MTTETEVFTKRQYVYIGQRESIKPGVAVISLRIINDDGTLGEIRSFDMKRGRDRNVGNIYSAEFSENKMRGLDSPEWVGVWKNQDDRIAWDAADRQTKTRLARVKLEAKSGRVSEIESILLPLRESWASMSRRGDHAGRRSLEDAVMSALRTAPRSFEDDRK